MTQQDKESFEKIESISENFIKTLKTRAGAKGFCVNWARLRLQEVLMVFDKGGNKSWQVVLVKGEDNNMCLLLQSDLSSFNVEVRSEW